jgi:hypothetical protein
MDTPFFKDKKRPDKREIKNIEPMDKPRKREPQNIAPNAIERLIPRTAQLKTHSSLKGRRV